MLLIKLVACNVVESCRHQLGNTIRIKKNCLTINNYTKMWGGHSQFRSDTVAIHFEDVFLGYCEQGVKCKRTA